MNIASRLRELRLCAGLSQEQLAERLDVTRQAVSKWESGQGLPDVMNVVKLSDLFGVTTDDLLKGQGADAAQTREAVGVHASAGLEGRADGAALSARREAASYEAGDTEAFPSAFERGAERVGKSARPSFRVVWIILAILAGTCAISLLMVAILDAM